MIRLGDYVAVSWGQGYAMVPDARGGIITAR